VQTAQSLFGINLSFIWLPALCYGLAVIPVFFYGAFEKLEPQIGRDLAERRIAAGAAAIAP
jgi:Na+/melibiose symporter-like transporter